MRHLRELEHFGRIEAAQDSLHRLDQLHCLHKIGTVQHIFLAFCPLIRTRCIVVGKAQFDLELLEDMAQQGNDCPWSPACIQSLNSMFITVAPSASLHSTRHSSAKNEEPKRVGIAPQQVIQRW